MIKDRSTHLETASSTEAKGVVKSGLQAFHASSYAICSAARALAASAAAVAAAACDDDDDDDAPIPCTGDNAAPPPKPCGVSCCCMARLRRLLLSRKILVPVCCSARVVGLGMGNDAGQWGQPKMLPISPSPNLCFFFLACLTQNLF